MKRVTRVERGTSRRSFLRKGIVSAGAATLSATVMGQELSAFNRADARGGPAITEGDIAILRFLAAAELIDGDSVPVHFRQYRRRDQPRDVLIAYLASKGTPMVNLDEFRRLPSSHAPGAALGQGNDFLQSLFALASAADQAQREL